MADQTLYNYQKKLTNTSSVTLTTDDSKNRLATDNITIKISADTTNSYGAHVSYSDELTLTNLGSSTRSYNMADYNLSFSNKVGVSRSSNSAIIKDYKNKWGNDVDLTFDIGINNGTKYCIDTGMTTTKEFSECAAVGIFKVIGNATSLGTQGGGPYPIPPGSFHLDSFSIYPNMFFNAKVNGEWIFKDTNDRTYFWETNTGQSIPINIAAIKKIGSDNIGTINNIFLYSTSNDVHSYTSNQKTYWTGNWEMLVQYNVSGSNRYSRTFTVTEWKLAYTTDADKCHRDYGYEISINDKPYIYNFELTHTYNRH